MSEPSVLEGLSPEKRELLELLLAEEAAEAEAFPLSYAQRGLWFLDRLQPGNLAYILLIALRLTGTFDGAVLRRALDEVVRRHEALRVTFRVERDEPVQALAPELTIDMPLVDLGALPAAEREAEVRRHAEAEGRRPFDLEKGPLLRATLLRLGAAEHVTLFAMHHIVSDAWSLGVLVREVAVLYGAFAQGRPSPLPELAVQYLDYVEWQRDFLGGGELERQIAFWRERLEEAPVLELPTDRRRRAVQGFRGGSLLSRVPAAVGDRFRALCQRHGATLFMGTLAVFEVLLHRYSGQDDLVVGTTIANRRQSELEGLIGLFVNTLALRADLSGDPSFTGLLARVRRSTVDAYAHQDLPFERLVAELRGRRDLSRSPLFQVMFQVQNAPGGSLALLPGLALTPVDLEAETAKFDLVVNLAEGSQGIVGQWKYDSDLFDEATVARMAEHFAVLLAGAVENPERRISELPLLAAEERRLLALWNEGPATPAEVFPLHRRFAEVAAAHPGAVAVSFAGEELTYAELAARSHRLARLLLAEGVRPGEVVGLCLERSPDLVVAILGVLAAGAAYLPLDPHLPDERITWSLEDAGARVLVTRADLGRDLPAARRIELDAGRERLERLSAESPGIEVGPDHPAYVIYTSGSTGRPKGVVIPHGNVARLFTATEPWFGFGPRDVWTLFHSYAFDFSVWELWGALLYGGRLVVVPYWVSRSPDAFRGLLREERVTVLNQTPSAFRQLLPASPGPDLRLVIFGGEALDPGMLAPWLAEGADRPRLVNMYGITETTVHVTFRPISREDIGRIGQIGPIGRPIPDLAVHLLDRYGQQVPIGVPGEIHVGGAGLAQGYLGRPELTAERFVPDRFSGVPGARLYRSGDLARRLPDGDLEYLGRIDHQVKIRGFRIELGEIEAALSELPGVRQAVVVVRSDRSDRSDRSVGSQNDLRLVAYLVAERELPTGELRDRLKAKLPEHMVPAAFVTLPALPLTPNGKVDRRALPAPDAARPALGTEVVEPRNDLECWLAALWGEVLKVERVGVRDDFFELGGSSISAAVVVNRLQDHLGEIVQVVVMFDHPTVEALAGYVQREHPKAVARLWPDLLEELGEGESERVDETKLARFRALAQGLHPGLPSGALRAQNPPALFVLAPPRSGTTLLRVMLGGHPKLFAPPELELLSFSSMAERKAAFSGRDSFWLEGLVRAVMEVRHCSAEEAETLLADLEARDLGTAEMYGLLQEWLGDRMLVDKTPSYALDVSRLRRAEEVFEGARYIHLLRHPLGMIRSFEEAKLDQIFFRTRHPFGRRELAELIWTASHENIAGFLQEVPAERQHRVVFEDLVREPERVLRGICAFLGIEYDPAMARPYEDRSARMMDGPHAESRMLGDIKLNLHQGVDADTAERWRGELSEDLLGDVTRGLAVRLGYALETAAGVPLLEPHDWQPGERIPLSFAQERLWFLDQLDGASATYNISAALLLMGRLDLPALESTLAGIVRRHAALRTSFAAMDGRPAQVIAPPAPFPLPCIDLAGLGRERAEAEARRLAAEDAARPFDLVRGPLLRATVLRLEDEEHAIAFNLHHIVGDGWSMGVLTRELAALYGAFVEGRPSPLPELPVQYADYAFWQREWLQGEELERQLAFWREALSDAAVLQLPTDRPRPPVQTFRGAAWPFVLPASLAAALASLGRSRGATLFMTLLAALGALLRRWAGQDDISIGSPVAGRNRVQLEGLIGFFVNTLVLRNDLSGDPAFRDLLARVREGAVAAFAHQEVPFEKIVEEVQPERDLSRTPLFQVLFALQNATSGELRLPGLTLAPFAAGADVAAKVDLTVAMTEGPGGLYGRLDYNVDLFEAATMERMAGHLETLLSGLAADPDRPLSALPLLTPTEEHQLLDEWVRSRAVPQTKPVAQLFAEQAARTPGGVALVFQGQEVTYSELAGRVSQLAHHLRDLGVGPEVRVAVALERSPDLIVAFLGVLEAGGAYVPIDRSYPSDRTDLMLEDSGANVVLGAPPGHEVPGPGTAPGEPGLKPHSWGAVASPATSSPGGASPGEAAAYVIYTSGSTGKPKGVLALDAGLATFSLAMADALRLGPGDRFLQFASPSFDASAVQIFPTLLSGATLVLHPDPTALSPAELLAFCADQGVTVLDLPGALWRQMVQELASEAAPRPPVRAWLTGGESLSLDALRQWAGAVEGDSLFLSSYGPTEATITTTVFTLFANEVAGLPSLGAPLGRPLGGAEVYLLDAALQPVPVGVTGELYAGGTGIARGYLGRPDLTAAAFLPKPWEPGARLYRTGDLARWRPDGALEFLGRADQQVKIRGFRVEPGEVEAALAEHPAVSDAAVGVHEERGDRRLVAWVVPAGDRDHLVPELRASLRERLPEHMVPSDIVLLDAMPLTPSGKVDRRALPAPDRSRTGPAPVAPRGGVEETLAAVWSRLLGVERVGTDDDFFDLGGHSLLATQLVSRVREVFGVELPLRQVFETPTLSRLAAAVEQARRAQRGMAAPPLQALPSDEPAPLSFAQERLWFLDQLQPDRPTYNMPTAVRLGGPLDGVALAAALGEVRRRHASLRTRFPVRSGSPVQAVDEPGPFPLARVDLSNLEAREAEAARLAVEDASRPFDLSAGPLLRATLVRLAGHEHVLLLNMHHIVSDGWSMGIFIEELGRSYQAFATGGRPELLVLPIQYGDYARWLRDWLRGEALEAQLGYWREKLGGEPAALELPLDKPRPAGDVFRGARRTVHVPLASVEALESLGRREEATIFMALVAAFETLLHRITGQTDISVGTPIAGRNRSELEGLIGIFVNTLVLRDDLAGDPTFRELLGRVRRTALDAYSHQDLPFEKIVEELQPQRNMGQTPLFQAMFVLQNTPAGALEAGELTLAPVPAYNETARFDLTMSVSQTPAGLYGWLEHKPDLLYATTVARWIEGFRRIVEAVAADPDLRLSELPLLSDAERHQAVAEWNDTRADRQEVCLHDLFAEQAARTPGAVAVMGIDGELTYAELKARAEELSGSLLARGVRPGDRVAIRMQPSPDRIAAVLAVLQTGAAYLPLDPASPQERLDFMIQDANASLVLSEEFLGAPASSPALHPKKPARTPALPGVLAYVIYTSGSTGQPKGVMIEHRQAVNTILDINRRFGIGPKDRIFAVSSLSFDLSVWDIFGTLAAGATIVLPPKTEGPDPAAWAERLSACGVTVWDSAPPLLEMLVESGARLPETLRLALLSGDWIPVSLPGRVRRQVPGCRVISLGGATEGSIWSILHPIREEDAQRRSIPYGRPMENQRFHLLDRNGGPVPIGVVGELCIGGDGVAGGYLGRRELTAERFAPDPFGLPGARLYRTGDLGRFLPDGTIEFLGRLDHQVKIRGFRVELGEIETVMVQHPAVREAVALVRTERATPAAGGDRRLVGYVVPAPETALDTPAITELRAWMAERLPDYMVPPQIVVLERLPVTANGKLDRRALPAPEALAREVVPPRDALEEQIAGIWRRLLEIEEVSIHDNFFELGGHSLLATRILAAVRDEIGVELPVREVFDRPTIAGLALAVAERRVSEVAGDEVARLLDNLDNLSDEEIERLLAQEDEGMEEE